MKIAIIGGAGKMGWWFAGHFQKEGKDVVISGRDQAKLAAAARDLEVTATSNTNAVRGADAVIISVPIESFELVVKEISPLLHEGQKVIDLTSVKTAPVEIMHRHIKGAIVLGAHPLFGPGARSVANQNFVLTPTNETETVFAEKVREYLEGRGGRVTIMSPTEHDEMMTIILGLAHFIALVSADTLASSDKLKKMEAIGGITYKVLLTLVESVLTEDPELYASLQMSLPGISGVEGRFHEKAREWAGLVEGKDRAEFIRRMKALRERFEKNAPGFGQAYEKMYKIAEGR